MLKKFVVLSFLVSLCAGLNFAHGKHENENQTQEITVKTIKITDRIYMLQGRGGNVGVSAGADGILIVDDDYAQVAPKISEALKSLGSDKPRFIFNTHWHGDHTQGNNFFGKDSIIVAHTNVRKRLATEALFRGEKFVPYPKFALPSITFDQSTRVHFNDEEILAVHYPNGHTDGDSVIFFTKTNVVHMGDNFFANRFPFVDMESGGSVLGLTKNVADVIDRVPADVKIIPGHGNLSTLTDLKNYHQMLTETTDIVQKAMIGGKTLEGVKKDGLPAKYQSWGSGFIKTDVWIETIYKSLSANRKQ
ncbi:MAG: MBL fold metallo-hydrolase [Acidobacteriota bacterium]|jgi:glyoxylase-like metal-dependent hydrolase (beta-lactamase superfamily II)|nr:MBL fold metallo-hydrolase [Acidobacteriota bacterium]MDQ3373719.1 MBL fold metallo-hydrolase [Acidobacteriota bacterium]